ncbi:hypothetical protein V6N11_017428 [Hibiscus sabdariffa]|uniref:Reverse transcriptase domain-containing protein n=1 Tax=Hibiscus sabdariffa TaxID=183260 RepID=A0ABR2TYH9_9ROSI
MLPHCSPTSVDYLATTPTLSEVRETLRSMAPLKAHDWMAYMMSFTRNIGISWEIAHSMLSKKIKQRWMAVKVDLEKAFDRIRLDFLRDTLVELRNRGGLAIHRSNEHNISFMQKLAFNLVSSPDTMWLTTLRQKYIMNSTCPFTIARPNCSPLWRALSKVWEIIRGNIFCLSDLLHPMVVPHVIGVMPPSLEAI